MDPEMADNGTGHSQGEEGQGSNGESRTSLVDMVKTLADTVKSLKDDVTSLKRKRPGESEDVQAKTAMFEVAGSSKAPDSKERLSSDSEGDGDNTDIDLDTFMEDSQDSDSLAELESFFDPEEGTGENVGAKIAMITEKALRGPKNKKDEERLQELKSRHRRPKNIDNLQVPKIEEYLWRQLQRDTKRVDYMQQRAVSNYCQAIVPLIKALDLMQAHKDPDTAKTHVMDCFKLLSLNVKATNLDRLERIKKDLHPKYKNLVPEEPAAKTLLGDNFQDAVKKIESSKANLTTSQSFLGKRGGDRYQSSPGFKQQKYQRARFGSSHRNKTSNKPLGQNNFKRKYQQPARR